MRRGALSGPPAESPGGGAHLFGHYFGQNQHFACKMGVHLVGLLPKSWVGAHLVGHGALRGRAHLIGRGGLVLAWEIAPNCVEEFYRIYRATAAWETRNDSCHQQIQPPPAAQPSPIPVCSPAQPSLPEWPFTGSPVQPMQHQSPTSASPVQPNPVRSCSKSSPAQSHPAPIFCRPSPAHSAATAKAKATATAAVSSSASQPKFAHSSPV